MTQILLMCLCLSMLLILKSLFLFAFFLLVFFALKILYIFYICRLLIMFYACCIYCSCIFICAGRFCDSSLHNVFYGMMIYNIVLLISWIYIGLIIGLKTAILAGGCRPKANTAVWSPITRPMWIQLINGNFIN